MIHIMLIKPFEFSPLAQLVLNLSHICLNKYTLITEYIYNVLREEVQVSEADYEMDCESCTTALIMEAVIEQFNHFQRTLFPLVTSHSRG